MKIAACFLLVAACCAVAAVPRKDHSQRAKGKSMPAEVEQANRDLEKFKVSKHPADLENAIRILEDADLFQGKAAADRLAARREVTLAWFRALNILDAAIDPAFNPEDMPLLNVSPPGPQYSSGVDPRDIKDPEQRARYEAAIAANNKKAEAHEFQSRLRFLDERATSGVKSFVSRFYTSAPADARELHHLMDEAKLSAARRRLFAGGAKH